MKKKIKNTLGDEKHLNNVLINILFISITIFIAIGSGIFFVAKLDDRLKNNEKNIEEVKKEIVDFKNDIIQINKLNNNSIDNKLYIYTNYNNDKNLDRLLKMADDDYNKQVNSILNKKPTK